jgi:hypothetical protein
MTAPKPRRDGRCWCSDGRYASPVDMSFLTDVERERVEQRVGIPHACWAHRDMVEAALDLDAARFRRREERQQLERARA